MALATGPSGAVVWDGVVNTVPTDERTLEHLCRKVYGRPTKIVGRRQWKTDPAGRLVTWEFYYIGVYSREGRHYWPLPIVDGERAYLFRTRAEAEGFEDVLSRRRPSSLAAAAVPADEMANPVKGLE